MPLVATIPMEQWGKDHWSTLLYVETCCVDGNGKLDDRKMRTYVYGAKQHYPTRLRDGEAEEGHDDWACLNDMMAFGLISEQSDGGYYGPRTSYVQVNLTDLGWSLAHQLRRFRSEKRPLREFVPVLIGQVE